jgi:hypothetical protein
MMMGPSNSTQSHYFVFTLNHQGLPNYVAGGMQLQVWNGEDLVSYKNGVKEGQLSQTDETVRWTQRLTVANGLVVMEIDDGSSQSWGEFGGQGYLKTSVQTSLTNLNEYRPYLSLTESGIGYGGNRVQTLELESVTWTLADGRVFKFTAPIDIDADIDP